MAAAAPCIRRDGGSALAQWQNSQSRSRQLASRSSEIHQHAEAAPAQQASQCITVELSGTKLWTLPPLVLGGIIENQNSDFVMQ
jgi:hypothetical protein